MQELMLLILVLLITSVPLVEAGISLKRGNKSGSKIKAAAVFQEKDAAYHKYSAILAASEPFLIQRNDEIRNALNPIVYSD